MAALQRDPFAPVPNTEVFGPTVDPVRDLTIPKISYGLPFEKAVLNHVSPDARAYIIASKTLSETTDNLERLKAALGNRVKGVRVGMTSHTIYQECLEVVAEAKKVDADTVITLGAGSLADAAKFVCKALVNDFSSVDDLARHNIQIDEDGHQISGVESKPARANLIFIPTSLSAGEHTPYAGITDRETRRKYQIVAAQASVTILDPWLCLSTPLSLWMQSGVRGIDHCVETTLSPKAFPEVFDTALKGLKTLVTGLIETYQNDKDQSAIEEKKVQARLNCQVGASLAILPIIWDVPCGASHGIGHMMGPMGVGHGETSCILLPAVCKYNASVTEERQTMLRNTLWDIPACERMFVARNFHRSQPDHDLGDLLDVVIRSLDMPRTLKERGIVGDKVQQLAKMSLNDSWLDTNPVPIKTEAQVMEILNVVRG